MPLKAGEVACDLCPVKRKAFKSCLDCMASYCVAHLEPHYQNEDLGRHLLISVVKNLEDSVCGLHGKQLNKFCRSDQTCICAMCAQTEHRGHHIISIRYEAAKKKVKRAFLTRHFPAVFCDRIFFVLKPDQILNIMVKIKKWELRYAETQF